MTVSFTKKAGQSEPTMNNKTEISSDLTTLERMVLEVALHNSDQFAAQFKRQIEEAKVSVRTPSGVGFMTKLQVPDELSVKDEKTADSLPMVYGEHPQLPSGAEFVLQIKEGCINCIEAFCYEGMWPDDESLFRVSIKENR